MSWCGGLSRDKISFVAAVANQEGGARGGFDSLELWATKTRMRGQRGLIRNFHERIYSLFCLLGLG